MYSLLQSNRVGKLALIMCLIVFIGINIVRPSQAGQLILRDYDFNGRDFLYEQHWASYTVLKDNGEPVTDLTLDDFIITESIVSPSEDIIFEPRAINIAEQFQEPYKEAGLWEQSLSDVRMDIVFILDDTGSMGDERASIISEIKEYIERLIASRVDFRLAAVPIDASIGFFDHFRLYNSMEVDKFLEKLDIYFNTAGESWNPSATYDALLYTPWFGFREGSRRIAVVITDIIPQTVYGTVWHPISCTAATLSAIEHLIAETNIEIYFSQPDFTQDIYKPVDIDNYVDNDINPRAGDEESGYTALMNKGLATKMDWPFQQERLPAPAAPLVDSKYVFAWESSFDWYDEVGKDWLSDYKEDYLARITLYVPDPDQVGNTLTATYTSPLVKEWHGVDLFVATTDEQGNIFDDLTTSLYYLIGDRLATQYSWAHPDQGVVTFNNIPAGSYYLDIRDDGHHGYDYDSLRALARNRVDIPAEGLAIGVQVNTADKIGELAKARGLLKDLDDWRVSGDPFKEFVAEAEAWLANLEAEGITWHEMIAIKRFYVTLSGYANITEYAQRMADGAINNFIHIVDDFNNIVEAVKDFHGTTEQDALEAIAAMIVEGIYDIITGGQFTVNKELLEHALDELFTYAGGQLQEELLDEVIDQIPVGNDYAELIILFLETLIDPQFSGGESSSEPADWQPVIDAAVALTIDGALDEVVQILADDFLDELFGGLELDQPFEQAIGALIEEVLNTLASKDGFDNFAEALEKFAKDVEPYVIQDRDAVLAAVNKIFQQLEGQLPPGDARDFLIGMARDLTMLAIPTVDGNNQINHSIDSDTVVAALIRHGLYNVVLKNYYIGEARQGLYQALHRAMGYNPKGEGRTDWERAMRDFYYYRLRVDDLQETAWDALRTQEEINNWTNALEGLVGILEAIRVPVDFLANLYWPFEDIADSMDSFIAVLDGIQIVSQAIEFGLRIDSMDTLGNEIRPLYLEIFPDPEAPVARMNLSPSTHDFGETETGVSPAALKASIFNTGSEELTVTAITLSDTVNYTLEAGSTTPTISAGEHYDLLVRFNPQSVGTFSATLTVTCPEATPVQQGISLTGKAGIQAVPAAPVLAVWEAWWIVTLYWEAVAEAEGYTLFYTPYPVASPIKSLDIGDRTSISFTLWNGAAFYVALKAYNSLGSSELSNIEYFILP